MRRASVEKVLERLGIEARRQGSRWWARRCPHPSHKNHNVSHEWKNFFIRSDGSGRAGLWTCFSCGSGGTLVDLVMAVRGLEGGRGFREAVDWLGAIDEAPAVAPATSVRFRPRGIRDRRFEMPAGVELPRWDDWNSVPRAYAESRGLTAAQVGRWGIGVAFEGRLQGRIVFPIRDERGVLSNYAARTFVDDPTRYLAAHEREGPDTAIMLGEVFWPVDLAERARATVVVFEGALSGMALERAIPWPACMAGLQGSAANNRRIAKLFGFGRVVLATDPDRAGDEVAAQISAPLVRRGVPVFRLNYPGNSDAADTPKLALREELCRLFGR